MICRAAPLEWLKVRFCESVRREGMGCGASREDASDEEVKARARRKFRPGDENVAESLKAAVSQMLKDYVGRMRCEGRVVCRTYESQVLGLKVSVKKRADESRTGGHRSKDWTSILVEEVLDDEPRIRPTDELVGVTAPH